MLPYRGRMKAAEMKALQCAIALAALDTHRGARIAGQMVSLRCAWTMRVPVDPPEMSSFIMHASRLCRNPELHCVAYQSIAPSNYARDRKQESMPDSDYAACQYAACRDVTSLGP